MDYLHQKMYEATLIERATRRELASTTRARGRVADMRELRSDGAILKRVGSFTT